MYGIRKLRDAVHSLQKDDLTHEHRKQLIDEAIEENGEEYVVDFILPHCSEAEVGNVIGIFISRGMWQALANLLQSATLNDKQRTEIIEGAANLADDLNFYKRIVPNSPSVKKQPSVEWFIRNGCWVVLGRILKREYISKDKRKYVVCKAAELADEKSFLAIVFPVCTREEKKSSILHHCPEAEVDNVIGTFLSRGMWQALAKMLQWSYLNDKQRAEVIEGAANLADDLNFYTRIVPNSPSVEKQPSVEWFIRNGCWAALGRLLKREFIAKDQRNYVVGKAAERADEKSLPVCTREEELMSILHLCSEAAVDNVIGTFLSRGMWQALASMLQWSYLNDKQRKEIIQGAANLADDLDFYEMIVPNSPSIEKPLSVEWLIQSGCWTTLGRLLEQEFIAKDKRNYVVRKAAELADEKSFLAIVLPFCTREEEKSSILQFVQNCCWSTIHCLERELPDELLGYMVSWAAEYADAEVFTRWILPKCDRDQTKQAAARIVKETCRFELVIWFQKKVNVDERQDILEISLTQGKEKTFDGPFFSACSVRELYYLVVQLAMKGWNVALCHLIYNVERRKDFTGHYPYRDAKRKDLFYALNNCSPPNVSAESPMKWAIQLGQPVVMRLLYESGCPSNAMLHTLCKKIETETPTPDEPKYLSFLRKVTTPPRTLKSLCRLAISRCLTEQDSVCHKDVETLFLPEPLKKYVMFSTETDSEDCKLWLKENGCFSDYKWALENCPKYDFTYFDDDYDDDDYGGYVFYSL